MLGADVGMRRFPEVLTSAMTVPSPPCAPSGVAEILNGCELPSLKVDAIPVNVTPFVKYKVGCVTPSSEYLLPLGVDTTVRPCNMVVGGGSRPVNKRFPSPLISSNDGYGVSYIVSPTFFMGSSTGPILFGS